jgi:LPXTG-motif cell wall-anchored protein
VLKNARQYQVGLTEEEKREDKRMAQELIETVEAELYPNRNKGKGGSGLIWFLVIAGIIVASIVGYFYGKRKREQCS